MKIIEPGHRYWLKNMEGDDFQNIQFIQKEEHEKGLRTVRDGTTNEEVLEMLIDRLEFLDKELPSEFTAMARIHLRLALTQLNQRTEERKQRGVEGTHKP